MVPSKFHTNFLTHSLKRDLEYTVELSMQRNGASNHGISIVYSTICSGAYQRKHQSSVSLAGVGGAVRFLVVGTIGKEEILRNNVHWGRGCRCDDLLSLVAPRVVFVTACGVTGRFGVVTLTAPPCSNACIPQIYMLRFRVHMYWYLSSLALRPNGRHFILQAVPWNPNWKMSVWFRCWLGAI